MLTSQPNIDLKKLSGLPLVLPGLPSGLRVRLEQNGRKAGITLNIMLEVEALSVMKEVVARSRIYTVLPYYAVASEVKEGTLSIARLVNPVMPRDVPRSDLGAADEPGRHGSCPGRSGPPART